MSDTSAFKSISPQELYASHSQKLINTSISSKYKRGFLHAKTNSNNTTPTVNHTEIELSTKIMSKVGNEVLGVADKDVLMLVMTALNDGKFTDAYHLATWKIGDACEMVLSQSVKPATFPFDHDDTGFDLPTNWTPIPWEASDGIQSKSQFIRICYSSDLSADPGPGPDTASLKSAYGSPADSPEFGLSATATDDKPCALVVPAGEDSGTTHSESSKKAVEGTATTVESEGPLPEQVDPLAAAEEERDTENKQTDTGAEPVPNDE